MNKASNTSDSKASSGSNQCTSDGHLLIGIAGGSAGGKTTFASELKLAAGDDLAILELDRFYHPLGKSKTKELPNFDEPAALDFELLETVLDQLRSNGTALVPRYDFATHDRIGFDRFDAAAMVILEGILVLWHPGIRTLLDLKIYVDAPAPLRFQRRLHRDAAERGRDVVSIQQQWQNTVLPMHEAYVEPSRQYADQVLDGTANLKTAASDLLKYCFANVTAKQMMR
jgi:uridine kinase|tara:strand:- start:893 stop:1576 length:684 start_codon:yes stop_codon:yes gene_type:complete